MEEERYWTPEDIADRLKINVRTVVRWITAKKLRAIRVGKQWRVPDSAIREFVEQQEGTEENER
jgi:excisionase family DNA binding protein